MGKHHYPEDYDDPDDDDGGGEWVNITMTRQDADNLRIILGRTPMSPELESIMHYLDMAMYPEPPAVDDDFPLYLEYPNENPLFPQGDGTYGLDEPDQ